MSNIFDISWRHPVTLRVEFAEVETPLEPGHDAGERAGDLAGDEGRCYAAAVRQSSTERGLGVEVRELVLLDHDLILGRNVLRELDKALREKIRLPVARVAELVDFVSNEATQVVDKAEPAAVNVDAADALVLGEALAGQA